MDAAAIERVVRLFLADAPEEFFLGKSIDAVIPKDVVSLLANR